MPAVQLCDLPGQREPDAEPTLHAARALLFLAEHLEDVWQEVGCDASARVAHAQAGFAGPSFGRDRDPPSRRRELGGVGDEVRDHLVDPAGVGLDGQRLRRRPELEPDPLRGHLWTQIVRRPPHEVVQVVRRALETHLAPGDRGEVEELVDQPAQRADVALDHVGGVPGMLRIGPTTQDFRPREQRRERRSQLVGDHGQELVLAPVRLACLLVEPRAIDGVGGAPREDLGHGQVGAFVSPPGLRGGEVHETERPPPRGDRSRHAREEVQGGQELGVVCTLGSREELCAADVVMNCGLCRQDE